MTEGLPSHNKAPWDASVTFPFYGTSNKIGGRKRTLLISITTDPLSGAWRDGTHLRKWCPLLHKLLEAPRARPTVVCRGQAEPLCL